MDEYEFYEEIDENVKKDLTIRKKREKNLDLSDKTLFKKTFLEQIKTTFFINHKIEMIRSGGPINFLFHYFLTDLYQGINW